MHILRSVKNKNLYLLSNNFPIMSSAGRIHCLIELYVVGSVFTLKLAPSLPQGSRNKHLKFPSFSFIVLFKTAILSTPGELEFLLGHSNKYVFQLFQGF